MVFVGFTSFAQTSFEQLRFGLVSLQKPLATPGPYDWLNFHDEQGQTMEDFMNGKKPLSHPERTIYLLKAGEFSYEETAIFNSVVNYLEVFFNAKVVVTSSHSLDSIPKSYKRIKFGLTQIKTPYILGLVNEQEYPDRLAYMAITNNDIYPSSNMNFVYGQGYYNSRKGVTSMFRLKVIENGEINIEKSLMRVAKTASHEVGHMLGFAHCMAYSCLMNGANTMEEAEQQPMHLCAECTPKLVWHLGLDFNERCKQLKNFWKDKQWSDEYDYYSLCTIIEME